jgi:hypothetical protein
MTHVLRLPACQRQRDERSDERSAQVVGSQAVTRAGRFEQLRTRHLGYLEVLPQPTGLLLLVRRFAARVDEHEVA